MTARVDRYARFFKELDHRLICPKEISQDRLFSIFGAEGLRRGYQAVSYLVESTGTSWEPSSLERLNEERRIADILNSITTQIWRGDIETYARVARTRDIQARTIRYYLRAAVNLMEHANVLGADKLTASVLDSFVRRSPGQTASLTPFISFVNDSFSLNLRMPSKQKSQSVAYENRLADQVTDQLSRLALTKNSREARSLIAALISRLLGLPLAKVLRVRWCEVTIANGNTVIQVEGENVLIPQPVGSELLRWLPRRRPKSYVFLGRNGVQPLTASAVKYHLDNATLSKRSGR